MGEVFPGIEVVRGRVSTQNGKVLRWNYDYVVTISYCSGLRKCVFMVWSSINGQNVDWSSWENCFPGTEELCGKW